MMQQLPLNYNQLTWKLSGEVRCEIGSNNRPVYSCKWTRDWGWPCFDTTLPGFLFKSCCSYANKYFSSISSLRNQRRIVQKWVNLSLTFSRRLGIASLVIRVKAQPLQWKGHTLVSVLLRRWVLVHPSSPVNWTHELHLKSQTLYWLRLAQVN